MPEVVSINRAIRDAGSRFLASPGTVSAFHLPLRPAEAGAEAEARASLSALERSVVVGGAHRTQNSRSFSRARPVLGKREIRKTRPT